MSASRGSSDPQSRHDVFFSFHGSQRLYSDEGGQVWNMRDCVVKKLASSVLQQHWVTRNFGNLSIFYDSKDTKERLDEIWEGLLKTRGGGVVAILASKDYFDQAWCLAELLAAKSLYNCSDEKERIRLCFIAIGMTVKQLKENWFIKKHAEDLLTGDNAAHVYEISLLEATGRTKIDREIDDLVNSIAKTIVELGSSSLAVGAGQEESFQIMLEVVHRSFVRSASDDYNALLLKFDIHENQNAMLVMGRDMHGTPQQLKSFFSSRGPSNAKDVSVKALGAYERKWLSDWTCRDWSICKNDLLDCLKQANYLLKPRPDTYSEAQDAVPDAVPASDASDCSSIQIDGSAGFVGVDFTRRPMKLDQSWNDKVVESGEWLENLLRQLIEYGSNHFGTPSLSIKRLRCGIFRTRIVVKLSCKIRLRDDLDDFELGDVKDICESLARLLKDCDASPDDINGYMIGSIWRGSLCMILEVHDRIVDGLFAKVVDANWNLPIGYKGITITELLPAFKITMPFVVKVTVPKYRRIPDVWLLERDGAQVLLPTSDAARSCIMRGGRQLSEFRSNDTVQYALKSLPDIWPTEVDTMVSWHSIERESKLVGNFLPSLPTHSENSVEHESLPLETSEAAADEADKVAHTRDSKPLGNETIDNEELDKWSKYVKEASMVDAEDDFGIFTGQTRDDKPHGKGTMEYSDGSIYTGDWYQGRWHGSGCAKFDNGDCYEGNYFLGFRHGRGTERRNNGYSYEGLYFFDERHGLGTIRWINGHSYEVYHYFGTRANRWNDGSEWKDGISHSRGNDRHMKSYHGTGLRKSTNRGAVHIFHSRSQLAHSTQDEYYNSFVDRGPPPDRRQINIKLNRAKMTTWPFKRKLALGNMNLGESDLPVDELVKTSLGNSLYKLSLRGNPLAVVPRQLVTNLPSLKHLDLSHCELSELPRIWDLPKLKVLNLSYNHISEFPSEAMLEGIPELRDLNLCSNRITEIVIPSNTAQLRKLESLNLGYNDLKGLPEELDRLKALRKLILAENGLEAIPLRVCSMKIKDIDVSSNPIIIPPIEICEQGISQMRLYYEAEHESKRPVAGVSFEEKYLQGSRTIGEGAFSTVFAGTDRASGRKVAIKVIDRSKMQWGDHDALQDEIENLRTLQGGPHIVELYDVYMPNSEECFLVMECLKGGELFDRILEKKTFSEDEARQVTRGLLEALQYMHSQKIAFRDVKPENILLESKDNFTDIKLVDFSLSKKVTTYNGCRTLCGTPGYIAPEILERFPAYGMKCDLWSTGVLLFVLLGGYLPFSDDTDERVFDRIRNAQYEFNSDYWNKVSVSAKNLIVRMLTVNPTNRISASQALGHEWMNSANEVSSVRSIPSAISIAGAISILSEVTMVPEIASSEVATVPEITSSEVTLPIEVATPTEVIAIKTKEQTRDVPRVIFIPSVVSTLSEVTMPIEIISSKGSIPSELMTTEQIPASSIFENETSVGLGEHGIDHKMPISSSLVESSTSSEENNPNRKAFHELYDLGGTIGTGRFSVTHEATRRQSMKKVSVKVVDRRRLLQSVDVAALQDEIDALRELVTCPQIIQLYEIFEEPDTTFLVMESLKGGNLIESITQRAHYTEADAKALFRNILLGVQFIHSKSIANRNLKPETLLLSTKEKNADVKISDFGYAKKVMNPNSLRTLCGTEGYIAPEILEYSPAYDEMCDMWSLGVTLYILIGGYRPFNGIGAEIIKQIRYGEYTFHDHYWQHVSKEAKDLIRQMLALDPSKRISASEALRSDWMALDDGDLQIDLSSNLSKLQALVGGTDMENIAHTLQESSSVCIPFDFVTRNSSIIFSLGSLSAKTVVSMWTAATA